MSEQTESSGMASLAICEAMLLALNDLQVLPDHEVEGILRDAAAFHKNAAEAGVDADMHLAAAARIHAIIAFGNLGQKFR